MQVKLSEQPDIRAGVLKWFDPVRGYGFLTLGEGQPDILLHADRLRASGLRALHEGSGIVARVEETGAGLRVVEILSVSEPTLPPAAPPAARPAGRLLPARVKWFERGRGYGFVRVFRIDEDVFVHNEVLRRFGIPAPVEGEALLVRVTRGDRGLVAAEVRQWDDIEPVAVSDLAGSEPFAQDDQRGAPVGHPRAVAAVTDPADADGAAGHPDAEPPVPGPRGSADGDDPGPSAA